MQLHPNDAKLLEQAQQALQAGNVTVARSLLQDAVARLPNNPVALRMMGMALARSGEPDAGIPYLDRAVKNDPSNPALANVRALILFEANRLDEAEQAYQAILGKNPQNPGALIGLSKLYLRMERLPDAASVTRRLIDLAPNQPDPYEMLGIILGRDHKHREAVDAFRAARERAPNNPSILANLSAAYAELGEIQPALDAIQKAAALAPQLPHFQMSLAVLHYLNGDFETALTHVDKALEADPAETRALATRSGLLNQLADLDRYRELMRFDAFLQRIPLTPPAGYATITAFNDALCDAVLSHRAQRDIPASLAAHRGSTVLNLDLTKEPFASLTNMLTDAVQRYRDSLDEQPAHPFLIRKSDPWHLDLWAVVLEDGGYQNPHHHRAGWLSGCYYARVPESITDEDPSMAGWIEFGRPDKDFPAPREPEVQSVAPKEGLLVLFPSYYWHRTIPFQDNKRRISIAFDIIPNRMQERNLSA